MNGAQDAARHTHNRVKPCKTDTGKCFQQVAIDGFALVLMYVAAAYLIDGQIPGPAYAANIAKYMILFVGGSFVLRYLDVDYADAIPRGAAVVIAAKFVGALALPGV